MPSPLGTTNPASLQPALESIYLATLQPETASRSLRKLLLDHPSYVGNLTENSFRVVLNINGDTEYESLGCVRYIPLLDRVYASINIKQDAGYSLQSENRSSKEFVRFYLSYDGGISWQDKGLSAVNVMDEPGEKPRMHLVTKKIDLRDDDVTEEGATVRSILSWNTPPPAGTPGWTPLWGNIAETQIQIEPFRARRMRDRQTKTSVRFADRTESKGDLRLPCDSADVRPVATMSTGHFSELGIESREFDATVV